VTRLLCLLLPLALVACASEEPKVPTNCTHATSRPAKDVALDRVKAVHGGHGPFAVAGYRMGEYALEELGLPRGSFALEVVHATPKEVQFSCVADGLQAATGTSPGKLTLRVDEVAERAATRSEVRNRETGHLIAFRLAPAFLERYLDLPMEETPAAGREVMDLPDEQVFVVEE
jgi:formylmethanofuran dehydrogenase subunit E